MNHFETALLVEDEPNLAIALKVALSKLNILSHHASTLRDAHALLASHYQTKPPELIILDRTLPDGDGLQLCAELRSQGLPSSILILTASGQVQDRVAGLNSGADDYLAKPFSWEELEARIRALARRRSPFSSTATTPLLWHRDESKLRILGPKGWVTLTPLEYKLASCLIEKKDSIVSRGALLKTVWGFTLLPQTRTVDHFLGRLRKYFEINPEKPRYFLTIRGAGYQFIDSGLDLPQQKGHSD